MVYIIAVIAIVIYCFFLLLPFFHNSIQAAFSAAAANSQTARDYYAVISSISSVLSGTFAVILGYFYYVNKKNHDDTQSKMARVRSRMLIIIDQLNKYDECIDEIVSLRIKSQDDLDKCRSKLAKCFEIICSILDNSDKLLIMSSDELETILLLNSFVDNNKLIMVENIDAIHRNAEAMSEVKYEYIEKLQNARKVCFLKTE